MDTRKIETLDVGCGNHPRGDVNVDLYLNEWTMHCDSKNPIYIDSKYIPNPIKADASYLPFKNETFDSVLLDNILEHLDNPTKALKEALRVSRRTVTFHVPHRFQFIQKRALRIGTHKFVFKTSTIRRWLETFPKISFIIEVKYKPFPSRILSIVNIPWEITAVLRKALKSGIEHPQLSSIG